MSRTVRVGVVGVGHHGRHHARVYGSADGAELVGVVDIDEARAKEIASEYGAVAYPDVDELLNAGVEAVSIATSTTAHCATAIPLLEAGIDVLVEKPLAASVKEARKVVDAANRHNRILQAGHIERFNGAVLALFESIKDPRFIECHRLSPYPSRGDDVSVVMDLMIHDLDIVLALDGTEAVSVDAIGVPVFSKHEDIANARIRFASGCVANVTCSRISVDRMRKIRIFERDTYVSTDYSEQEVLVYRKKEGELPPGKAPMDMITIEPLEVTREEPLRLELASFLDCVRDRKRPECSGEDGLAAMEVAEKVIASVRKNV